MDIIDRIINIRKQRGISQQKLSEMTGILQPVIARVESKKSSPTVEFLQKILDALDLLSCPFKSFDNEWNDFIHGDLCLPNIIVDDEDGFLGFLDVSNAGKGDKQYDYCWLLWSFEYNLKTNQYNNILLKELNIEIDSGCYLKYVINNLMN